MSTEKNNIFDEEYDEVYSDNGDLITEIEGDLSSAFEVPNGVKRLFKNEYGDDEVEDDNEDDLDSEQKEKKTKLSKKTNNRKRQRIMAKTIAYNKRLTKEEEQMKKLLAPYKLIPRPRSRADCLDGLRPCPFASCRHHLFIDVTDKGSLKLIFPNLEINEIPETCSLDIADKGEHTLDEIGNVLSLTWERVRQIEATALLKLKWLLKDSVLAPELDTSEERLGVAAKEAEQTSVNKQNRSNKLIEIKGGKVLTFEEAWEKIQSTEEAAIPEKAQSYTERIDQLKSLIGNDVLYRIAIELAIAADKDGFFTADDIRYVVELFYKLDIETVNAYIGQLKPKLGPFGLTVEEAPVKDDEGQDERGYRLISTEDEIETQVA